jgi:hypothetical protein
MPTVTVYETGYPDGVAFGGAGILKTRVRVLDEGEETPDGAIVVDNATPTYDWTVTPVTSYRELKIASVPLGDLDTGGGVFAWANPEGEPIAVTKVELDVQTRADAACTVDVGTTTVSSVTSSDNLLDGMDVRTEAGLFGIASQAGANGGVPRRLAAGKWVTGSNASGAAAGLVGFAHIHYYVLPE